MTTTDTDELVSFMRARLDEAESSTTTGDCQCEYHDVKRPDCPDFVLADVEAKRRIVAYFADVLAEATPLRRQSMSDLEFLRVLDAERTLGWLAQPFASHPNFRDEWRMA